MTAKQELHARVARMSDAEAERLLSIASARLGPLSTPIAELPTEEEELSAEDLASIEQSYADLRSGASTISIDELRGELG
jgi:hypothetical protein